MERKELCERSHFFLLRISSGRRVLEEARGRTRAREEESSQTARGKRDGKTRSAGPWETQEEPAGIVGGKSFVSFGEPFRGARAPGSPSPPPRSDLLQTRSCPRGSPPAAGTPPARRDLWLHLQICLFWGFSTLVEGIGLRRRNFFPFKKNFFGRRLVALGFPHPLSSTISATVVLAEGKGLRWRGWLPRMGR